MRAKHVFDGRRFLPGGALILIQGSTVAGVQSYRSDPPADCEPVDVAGTVLPGLIDTHVHLCADGDSGALDRLGAHTDAEIVANIEAALSRHLAAGVTTVRDLGDRDFAVLDWLAAAGPGRRPTVLGSGPPITTVGGHCWNMGGAVSGPAELRAAVAARAERGASVVKIMASGGFLTPGSRVDAGQFSEAELRIVVEEAHRRGLPVTAHAHPLVSVEQAIAVGVDGIEHCTGLTEHGAGLPETTVTALREAGVTVCPTLGQTMILEPTSEIAAMLAARGLTPELIVAMAGQAHALLAGGVRVITGSDGGVGEAKPHGIAATSIEALAGTGADSATALATATSVAAAALGLGAEKGLIQTGYDADFVVVAGDPETDIAALHDVRQVYLGGLPVGRAPTEG